MKHSRLRSVAQNNTPRPSQTTRPPNMIHTATSLAYARLRADILQGTPAPDEKLRVNDVSERYRCGPIPVRKALNRLAAEGLVAYSEQRGFAVAPIGRADLIDLTKARSLLVEVAMREAILHNDAAW